MKPVTIAEAYAEFRNGLPLSSRWVGIDREYVALTLALSGLTFVLTAQVMGGTRAWVYRGRKAVVLFERLAGATIDPAALEARYGLRPAA